jgi:quercetin dioxygenase-like cupin family protein
MEKHKIEDFKGGWFIGNFIPSSHITKDFEVCYKKHFQGEKWPVHYHKESKEINYLVRGKMKIQNQIIEQGDIFILHPYEVADPVFLEDCEVLIVKTPSVPGDKYEID